MVTSFKLPDHCFIIAEAGVNHNGNLDLALQLVDKAAEAGADAVKFQTFKSEKLVSPKASKANYQVETTGNNESQLDMIRRLELSTSDHEAIIERCKEQGICFLSTPFDLESVDLLESLGVPAYKLPSGEITNLPLLKHVAKTEKMIFLSTGMSYLGEVEQAVNAIRSTSNAEIILLQCVSNYPADPSDVNLRAMHTMAQAFQVEVGYSDHTPGDAVTLAAVALGARVIEKHFTLDRELPGPDHRSSLEPHEITEMVRSVRTVEAALGNGIKAPAKSEANTASVARKSLVIVRDMSAGERLGTGDIAILRPGTGLAPSLFESVLGRTLGSNIESGTPLQWEHLS